MSRVNSPIRRTRPHGTFSWMIFQLTSAGVDPGSAEGKKTLHKFIDLDNPRNGLIPQGEKSHAKASAKGCRGAADGLEFLFGWVCAPKQRLSKFALKKYSKSPPCLKFLGCNSLLTNSLSIWKDDATNVRSPIFGTVRPRNAMISSLDFAHGFCMERVVKKWSDIRFESLFTTLSILRRLSPKIAPLSARKRRGAHAERRAATSLQVGFGQL